MEMLWASVTALVSAQLLPADALLPLRDLNSDHVDFGALYRLKRPLLFDAHAEFVRGGRRIQATGNGRQRSRLRYQRS